jgi:molybdenum cofactor cytidylyltransferase/nicotine blue oxidoreductase
MGSPKAELVVDGERLLDRAASALREGGCDPVYAVVRDGTTADAIAVVNPAPERGMRSSLELGVAAAGDVEAIAVLLVDMPGIGADAVRAVVQAWSPERIAIGRVGGRRVHPTVMAPPRWQDAIADAREDEGARRYLTAHPELVDEIDVPGSSQDLDTPEDLSAYQASER